MKLPAPISSSVGRSKPLTRQQLVNIYPEKAPDNARSRVAFYGSRGLDKWSTPGSLIVRAMLVWQATLYAIVDSTLYSFDTKGNSTSIGDVGSSQYMSASPTELVCADAGLGYLDGRFVFGGNVTEGYVYDKTNLTKITDAGFSSNGGSTLFVSDIDDATSYDATYFATTETALDGVTHLFVDHRDIHVFGSKSVEVWRNVGASGFPLRRVEGASVERYGSVSPGSVASFDNHVMYLDSVGIVRYFTPGAAPQRVSTHSIESRLNEGDWQQSDAFVYVEYGHEFYCLYVPNVGTLVYDAATRVWHDRKSNDKYYWRAKGYVEYGGKELVGDRSKGTLWEMTGQTEDGNPLPCEITFAPIYADGQRFTIHDLRLDFEPGVGNTVTDPQVMLEWSEDGQTWKALEEWRSMGKAGDYSRRLIWRRLGQHRQFHARARITNNVERAFYAAYVTADVQQ